MNITPRGKASTHPQNCHCCNSPAVPSAAHIAPGPVSGPFPAVHQENDPKSWLSKSNPLLQLLSGYAVPLPHAAHLSSPGLSCRQGSSLTKQKVNKAQNSSSFYARLVFCWISGLNQCTKESGGSLGQGKERSVQKDTTSSRPTPKCEFGTF